MPGRWSVDQVLALASDMASATAERALGNPLRWRDAGASGDLLWGLCAGSGATPYQVVVDVSGPAYRCTCPSRKFPCKHALGLLLGWSAGTVPDAAEPADYAAEWKEGRESRLAAAPRKPRGERDEAAAAKRAQQRTDRVGAGLAELEIWLRDQVRGGLSVAAGTYAHADPVAARMVDAQAPGVAGLLRRLSTVPASGDGWPHRLLAGYGRVHLLARAHAQLDSLPSALAATVRTHVGYTVTRAEVLADPAVADDWLVLAVRDLTDGAVPARRTWLRGATSGRYALVLVFDPQGDFGGNEDAWFVPGTTVSAEVHYYPGRAAARVVIGARHGEPAPAPPPEATLDVAGQLAEWAAVVELDPWLGEWPAVLRGVPVRDGDKWRFVDQTGASVPVLLGGVDPWVLVAVAGGSPTVTAGEFTADGFRPLTVWHGDEAIRL
ncbi:MAG: SWIM zinc finger family protein [Jatrophihabitans sp.]|uniref:SWIM zinc finger family protein n=1 Tax=Jatrophihabitans sp. TaxID=1932789 RepID=UPI0039168149